MTNEIATKFSPSSRQEWRQWLQENHSLTQSVWLVYHKKSAQVPNISWSEAVDEAICFGWIDSLSRPLDQERYIQFFSKRKPGSGWSKINKNKAEKLIEAGLMQQAGYDAIEAARKNGSWSLLDEVEELVVPDDLQKALADKPVGSSFFQKLSRSDKRNLLQWLVLAKKTETRQKRIKEIVEFADQNLKPRILKWTKKTEP
ncbi:YdeI/OmpD-associated family protein [Dyadobacter chenhuakuii]|uniref:YdeI/OmpD-associated family protein n=1 Tax=Dyadobacter chenhuakuii TaxID=2909339 RepID=A0A9X1TUI5_9BACT|nr:YdeI/OmpD-associated family protein [Dyadobacter chenhuakuii]MCF2501369.1 YdeI/OmpD-associated family protein [Dyadobacter chenhuakuii]